MMLKSKFLGDAGWKDLASKNKLKDNGLAKSLEKLKRVGDDDHDDQAKILEEVVRLVAALKKDKAVAAAPAVVKYLGEVQGDADSAQREVAKSRAEHEKAMKAKAEAEKAAAKKAEQEDEADEDEESPELLTTKLKPLLKLVAKGETMHTLLAKSGKQVVVMLSRKPIPPARRKLLAEQLGGGSTKYYPGTCGLEAGATTFALKSEVAGLSKLVKKAVLEQTGLRLNKIKCRGEDGDDHDDDDDAPAESDGKDKDGAGAKGADAPSGVPKTPAAPNCATPDATATDCFFDHDSSALTDSDKTFLDAYAKAFLGSRATDTIVLEGFASEDGDKGRNATLAAERAQAVLRHLLAQGVSKDRVRASGKGPTAKFSADNPCLNRRVTLQPAIELKVRDFVEVTQEEPGNVPHPGPAGGGSSGEKAPQVDPSTIDLPKPPETVSREFVRDVLEDWLIDLGQSQKVTAREADVMSTSRVYVAEEALLGRPGGEDLGLPAKTPVQGDGNGYRAGTLADRIANNLPDRIPRKNFDNFLKLRARDVKKPKSIAGQAGDKLGEWADEKLSEIGVPKKHWEKIKSAVRKGLRKSLEQLDGDVKEAALKAYDVLEAGDKKSSDGTTEAP